MNKSEFVNSIHEIIASSHGPEGDYSMDREKEWINNADQSFLDALLNYINNPYDELALYKDNEETEAWTTLVHLLTAWGEIDPKGWAASVMPQLQQSPQKDMILTAIALLPASNNYSFLYPDFEVLYKRFNRLSETERIAFIDALETVGSPDAAKLLNKLLEENKLTDEEKDEIVLVRKNIEARLLRN